MRQRNAPTMQMAEWKEGPVNTATRPNTRGEAVARMRRADIEAYVAQREAALLAEVRMCCDHAATTSSRPAAAGVTGPCLPSWEAGAVEGTSTGCGRLELFSWEESSLVGDGVEGEGEGVVEAAGNVGGGGGGGEWLWGLDEVVGAGEGEL